MRVEGNGLGSHNQSGCSQDDAISRCSLAWKILCWEEGGVCPQSCGPQLSHMTSALGQVWPLSVLSQEGRWAGESGLIRARTTRSSGPLVTLISVKPLPLASWWPRMGVFVPSPPKAEKGKQFPGCYRQDLTRRSTG